MNRRVETSAAPLRQQQRHQCRRQVGSVWFAKPPFVLAEKELAGLARRRFQANLPVLSFQNALRDGQAQAFALSVRRIQAMKNLKDFPLMFRSDADAVVFHRIGSAAIFPSARDVDSAGPLWLAGFEGVVEEVGKELVDLRRVT